MGRAQRKWITALIMMSLMGFLPAAPALAVAPADGAVFISEIHYDNDGADTGEAVEIFGPAGTDLTGWSLVFYNGSTGAEYATEALSGAIPDLGSGGSGFGVVVVTRAGIQNGAPDGIALVDNTNAVRQFLSYEGSFVGVGGPAGGLTSTDINVSQSSSTSPGLSLHLEGTGACYGDFTWYGATPNSFGSFNLNMVPDATSTCDDGGTGGPDLPPVRFSEIHYDNAGGDVGEAIEIFGPAGSDLSGWTIVHYNGNGGVPYGTDVVLAETIPDLDGVSGVVVVNYPSNGLQNGSPDGVALVDAGGAVVEFLSYEGVITAVGGPADGLTSTDLGVSEPSSTAIGESLQRAADGVWGGPFCASFGAINNEFPESCALELFIHEIQGSVDDSLHQGERVIVEGVVVGDHEGFSPTLRGFFVQEEDTDADANPATSEGIFVFNFNNDDVDLGDVVRVEGTVAEFRGGTQLTDFVVVEVLDVEPRVATPATITFPVGAVDDLEAYEGMAVTMPQDLVISEYFNYDRFGEIVVALPAAGEDRPYNPTALFDPDSTEASDRLDLNLRSRITVDDGNSFQNPSDQIHPINRDLFTLDNAFRGGDQVAGLTGPVYEAFGSYRILPYGDGGFETYVQTDRPTSPDDVGGDITVATLNVLNYFLTLDNGVGEICGPDQNEGCRGADNAGELARQRVKLLNALEILNADVVGLTELENTSGVEALADLVNGLNDRLGAGTYDYIAAGTDSVVGPDVIKVGIIYKPGSVSPLGDVAILDTDAFLAPNTAPDDPKNRAAVAATFVEDASGEVFSVVVNHLKSKGSGCGAGDDHPLAGSCNLTRTLAAQELADWLTTNPTGVADNDWLIIGDLNSYDKEDPISALSATGYTDLIGHYQGELAYSYVFDGQYGYLDYAMSSASITSQVTGATVWNINSDEPDIFDYDTSFKSDYQDGLFEPDNPFRSSDHDAVLVGLSLDGLDETISAEPDKLWSPNHKLNPVTVSAVDSAFGPLEVMIFDAMSSEADSGLGDEDVPNDINIVSDTVVELRSERFSIDGRTYTIYVTVSGDGQVMFGSVDVIVDHDQRDKKKK